MPWYLYIAIRHLFPEGKRLTFFTALSVIGVSLGVMVLIIVISVFNGFGHELRRIISETSGDLRVMSGGIFENYDETMKSLADEPIVEAVTPAAFGMVMLQSGNRPLFPSVQGIDPVTETDVVPIGKYLIEGDLDDLDDDSILISSGVSNTLRLFPGDEVDIYTPLMLEKLKQDQVLLPRLMRVAGIFETGFSKIDESLIITTLRTMQDLYGMGDGVHAIKIKLVEGVDPERAAVELQSKLKPPFRVSSWVESNADFLAIIAFEKRMMFFLLLFIVLVSSISIATSLMTSVVRKTREIGLYLAMGASNRQIAACFTLQGVSVGVFGTALGFAMAFGVLSMRDSITNALFWIIGSKEQTLEFYFFSRLPVHIDISDLSLIAVFAVVIATLAGLVPAFLASRLKPVEALRSE